MTSDTLIFKDKIIRDKDVELIFHKDAFWIYNDDPHPVIKFTLKNCKNLDKIDFSSIDYYNDGLTIEIKQIDNHFVFETTDIGNIKMTAYCDKIEKEELEYSNNDYIYLIKEFTKQRDEAYNSLTTLNERIDSLRLFLYHEDDVINRKINQASWLTDDKKHFLDGRQEIIKIIIDKLNQKKD
ncbi:MAG: hypothetical protein WBC06_13245 [Chitinophagaceae bacterium]